MSDESESSPAAVKERKPSKYVPGRCPGTVDQMCKDIDKWAKFWEIWGNDVLGELDDLKGKVKKLMEQGGMPSGPGTPPTDATKPPKPPFGGS